jgi:hypothetical protein
MLLSLVVPEAARFFYREAGEIQWSRSFQSVVEALAARRSQGRQSVPLDNSARVTTLACINNL